MKKSIREKISGRIIIVGVMMFFASVALSYGLFIPKMEQDAVNGAGDTNAEVIKTIDRQIAFVQDYTENLALSVAQNQEILRYFEIPSTQAKNVASLHLNNLISYEGTVRCVLIADESGVMLDSLNKVEKEDRELVKSKWYKKLRSTTYGRGVSEVYQVDINNTRHYTAAYLKNFYYGNKKYTYTVFMDLNDMIRDFQVLAGKQLDYAAIADSEKKIFISVGDKKWEKQAVVAAASDQMNTLEAVAGGTGFVKTSLNSKWRVISYVADKTIFMSFSFYVVGIMTVLFLFTLVTLGILSKAIGNILKPLSELSGSMEEVAKGNLDCKLTQFPEDEIGMLSRTFNQMTVDLKDSLELLAKKERQEQQIRFSLLISQIDPHFIYNTINSINYLARRGRCNDVIKVNSALISILQDRLRVNDIQVTDTIANERKVVEQYLVIERYMYDGDLEVAWKIENELMTEQIPKNMIQPLVENALFHGLIDEESGELNGKIEIEIQRDEKDLILRVSDNGIGMSEDRLKAVREEIYQPEERGKKIGLSNIGRRLYYLYGSSDGIRIESGENEGTRITLKFKGEYFEEH